MEIESPFKEIIEEIQEFGGDAVLLSMWKM